MNGETYHKFTAQQFARQATKLDNGIQIMATTTGLLEKFPGAYSGTGEAWERKAKEAIGLLPDRHGFSRPIGGARTEASGHDHGGVRAVDELKAGSWEARDTVDLAPQPREWQLQKWPIASGARRP